MLIGYVYVSEGDGPPSFDLQRDASVTKGSNRRGSARTAPRVRGTTSPD